MLPFTGKARTTSNRLLALPRWARSLHFADPGNRIPATGSPIIRCFKGATGYASEAAGSRAAAEPRRRAAYELADIDVTRRRPVIWPMMIGAIVLGLLIWGLIRLFDRDEETRIDPPATVTDTAAPTGQ